MVCLLYSVDPLVTASRTRLSFSVLSEYLDNKMLVFFRVLLPDAPAVIHK